MKLEINGLKRKLELCGFSQHIDNMLGDDDRIGSILFEGAHKVEEIPLEGDFTFKVNQDVFYHMTSQECGQYHLGKYYRNLPGLKTGFQRRLAWDRIAKMEEK